MVHIKKAFFLVLWLLSTLVCVEPCIAKDSVEFFILICSYNNAKWCKKNLESVFCQTYPHWRIYYVDACSNDDTGKIVDNYIQQRGFSDKCTVVHKTTRTMASENFYYAIKDCDPRKVVVQLDGDDWLAHKGVLTKLSKVYDDPNVWMTYGNFRTKPQKKKGTRVSAYPEEVIRNCSFRKYRWHYVPLRTFYAALFQKIPMTDFLLKGEFVSAAHDAVFGFPLLEMASEGHCQYIKEVLYIYNIKNPISDFRIASGVQGAVAEAVRQKPPYKQLETLF